jgi:hypothetical protein
VAERDYSECGDINVLINALALMPYAVKLQQAVPVRIGDRIPPQRREEDGTPWSMVHAAAQATPIVIPRQRSAPPGVPARSTLRRGGRSIR